MRCRRVPGRVRWTRPERSTCIEAPESTDTSSESMNHLVRPRGCQCRSAACRRNRPTHLIGCCRATATNTASRRKVVLVQVRRLFGAVGGAVVVCLSDGSPDAVRRRQVDVIPIIGQPDMQRQRASKRSLTWRDTDWSAATIARESAAARSLSSSRSWRANCKSCSSCRILAWGDKGIGLDCVGAQRLNLLGEVPNQVSRLGKVLDHGAGHHKDLGVGGVAGGSGTVGEQSPPLQTRAQGLPGDPDDRGGVSETEDLDLHVSQRREQAEGRSATTRATWTVPLEPVALEIALSGVDREASPQVNWGFREGIRHCPHRCPIGWGRYPFESLSGSKVTAGADDTRRAEPGLLRALQSGPP